MNDDIKKYLPILIRILLIALIVFSIYFISTTLIFYILPFVLGWMIASFIEPTVDLLHRQLRFPRGVAAFVSTLFFVLFVSLLISLFGGIIIVELTKLSIKLPSYSEKLYLYSMDLFKQAQELYINLPYDITQSILKGLSAILNHFTGILGRLISSSLVLLSGIPNLFVFLLVTIISAFFIARDKALIVGFIKAQIPKHFISKGHIIKHDLLAALVGYVKTQLILMSITFVESAIGLSLIGIDYAVLIALFTSMIDALPIFGTGSVFIPMILWHLILGKYRTALYLGILYGIIVLVRQLLEPKVLGNQIGLYPLVTLMSMYIGLKLFGVIGLIIGPISMITLITFQKVGFFPRWK